VLQILSIPVGGPEFGIFTYSRYSKVDANTLKYQQILLVYEST
jgi:hypothetical protein